MMSSAMKKPTISQKQGQNLDLLLSILAVLDWILIIRNWLLISVKAILLVLIKLKKGKSACFPVALAWKLKAWEVDINTVVMKEKKKSDLDFLQFSPFSKIVASQALLKD